MGDRPVLNVPTVPGHDGALLYQVGGGLARPFEFNGWRRETLSWKNGCYLHAGLSSPAGQIVYRGPDAIRFWEGISVNSYVKFPVGGAKHAVMCNDQGLITGHGVLRRNGPEEVQLFVSGMWAAYQHHRTSLDVEQVILDNFLFQISGPTAIQVLEKATGESLWDIGFLRFRKTTIAGHEVDIMRVGMSGTLAFELHGPMALGEDVYHAVVRAGDGFGLERLGWRSYLVNHIEGGFPQLIWTFWTPANENPDYMEYMRSFDPRGAPEPLITGSVDPADMRSRYRNPWEVGWEKMVRFDHDFIGRDALEREAAAPRRTIVTLAWNADDVIDIHASLMRPGEPFRQIDLPTSPPVLGMLAHADHVLNGGRRIGISSGTVYSLHYRTVLSHCVIDIAEAEVGNEVVVEWGDHGGPIKQVRARVERYPYIDLARNQDIDLAAI